MEAKKNPSADIHAKSGVFFFIGLSVSITLVIVAFEWRTRIDPMVDLRQRSYDFIEPLPDVIRTEIKPKEARKILNPVIKEVKDTEVIDTIKFILNPTEQEIDTNPAPEPEPIEVSPEIMLFPEVSALPVGGFETFYKYVSANIKYPAVDRRMQIEGRVYVEFVIDIDGRLTQARVVKGISTNCDAEALRVIQEAPPWNPGKQRGRPVKQRYTLPIIFKLG